MPKRTVLYGVIFCFLFAFFSNSSSKKVLVGAENKTAYIPLLQDKKVGVVANQTSLVGKTHLVDFLLNSGVEVQKIFSPEHGFRGTSDAGQKVDNTIDHKTGLPIISLYGNNKTLSSNDISGLDYMVFDIQDVGVRFYTYISTLHYVMKACAENNVPLVVLDRPNPNIHYIDGPLLKKEHASFVGMHPVPVVYGMTIGEYARMINGENWLGANLKAELAVIPCLNYTRGLMYELPVKPSPNLPNYLSILLYPGLCFFEGTVVSVGRGTEMPFQHYGHPTLDQRLYSFTPKSIPGMSKYPKHQDKKCYGYDLRHNDVKEVYAQKRLDLSPLINMYKQLKGETFFNAYFVKLAGTENLEKQIKNGLNEDEIRKSWQQDIEAFKKIRMKYLLYE